MSKQINRRTLTRWSRKTGMTTYDIDIEIDIDKIAEQLLDRAIRSKTGKAAALLGAVKVKTVARP